MRIFIMLVCLGSILQILSMERQKTKDRVWVNKLNPVYMLPVCVDIGRKNEVFTCKSKLGQYQEHLLMTIMGDYPYSPKDQKPTHKALVVTYLGGDSPFEKEPRETNSYQLPAQIKQKVLCGHLVANLIPEKLNIFKSPQARQNELSYDRQTGTYKAFMLVPFQLSYQTDRDYSSHLSSNFGITSEFFKQICVMSTVGIHYSQQRIELHALDKEFDELHPYDKKSQERKDEIAQEILILEKQLEESEIKSHNAIVYK